MKHVSKATIAAIAILLIPIGQAFAVVGQVLQIQGTNLVLTWPSQGNYQQYLIQYRETLDPSTPWVQLTNAYPANSYTIYGVVPPSGGNGGGVGGANPPPNPLSVSLEPTEPMVTRADGTGAIVPLAIYPPGFDLSNFLLFDPTMSADWLSGNGYVRQMPLVSSLDSLASNDSGGSSVTTGFFRVSHIPNWAFNIANYTYGSSWFFPVDFKDYRDRVKEVQVLLNGEPTPYAEFMEYSAGNWGCGIDFDRLTNGTYQIQLLSTVALNDETDDKAAILVLSNSVKSIVVANQVMFPAWNNFIQGNTYTFNAQLANANTNWTIDIFDAWGDYVNSGSGHTYSGQVSWLWNQYDYMGNYRDDFDNDPYFDSQITFNKTGSAVSGFGSQANAAQTTEPMPTVMKGYPNRGEWIIAFQDRWFSDTTAYPSCQEGYMQAMQNNWSGPQLVGDTSRWFPLSFGTNYTQAEREQSWTNLLTWMGDLYTRNFYYHGHGGATSIGCDKHTYETNGVVTGGTFSYAGSKSEMESWQIAKIAKYNRFRFVFLDGCLTASGNLPGAFGVSKTAHDLPFYENDPQHPRPSVFVGWNEVTGGEPGTSVYKWLDFEKNWMGIWANDSDHPNIQESLERANLIFGWLDESVFRAKIRLYGYQAMKIGDFNKKGDWRWE